MNERTYEIARLHGVISFTPDDENLLIVEANVFGQIASRYYNQWCFSKEILQMVNYRRMDQALVCISPPPKNNNFSLIIIGLHGPPPKDERVKLRTLSIFIFYLYVKRYIFTVFSLPQEGLVRGGYLLVILYSSY